MAWIESHQEVAHHPKTRKLAKKLDLGTAPVIGHLHALWWWAVDYAPDGSLEQHTDEDIAIGAFWENDPKEFVDALVECRWLDRDGEHLSLHDWEEYAGRLLDRRKANAERKRLSRARHTDAAQVSAPVTGLQNITKHDLTEPDQTKTAADAARFDDFWNRYPKRNGKRIGRSQAFAVWKRLSDSDRDQVDAAVEHYRQACEADITIAKDAHRWLSSRVFRDWLEPAQPNGHKSYSNSDEWSDEERGIA